MTPALAAVYQRIILEHNARPRNLGPLSSSTHEAGAHNALCGDTVTLRLQVEGGRIVAAAFEGNGCALSRASASLLTLAVAGQTVEEAGAIGAELRKLLARGVEQGEADVAKLGDLVALQGVREVPARLRCATLAWEALGVALG